MQLQVAAGSIRSKNALNILLKVRGGDLQCLH